MKTMKILLVILLFLLAVSTTSGQIIYVDANATGANNGSSWENAYKYLQDALTNAHSDPNANEIRVAQGTYKPDRSSAEPNGSRGRAATFQLINGVALKGGYASVSKTTPNDRNVESYASILSGDLAGNDSEVQTEDLLSDPNRAENSYHVVAK